MSTKVHRTTTQDVWVEAPEGRLFARIWSPAAATRLAPIILLHDSLGAVELWRGFPAALCARTGRTVIAYDRLGFGRSSAHPGLLAADFVSTETDTGIAAIRTCLDIGRFVLFGHSVGGGMAVCGAAQLPDACVALVTEAAQAFVEDQTIRGIEIAREMFKNPKELARLEKYHDDKAKWVLDAWIETWLDPAFASWSLRAVLPDVTCPVLAIHGADDEFGTPLHPRLIGELAGGPARVEVMPATRHVPHREKEAEVAQMVADFLQDVP